MSQGHPVDGEDKCETAGNSKNLQVCTPPPEADWITYVPSNQKQQPLTNPGKSSKATGDSTPSTPGEVAPVAQLEDSDGNQRIRETIDDLRCDKPKNHWKDESWQDLGNNPDDDDYDSGNGTPPIRINGRDVILEFHSGTVAGVRKESNTHVYGGGHVERGRGSFFVNSRIERNTEFFLVEASGREIPYAVNGEHLRIRNGQSVTTIHALGRSEEWAALVNHSTGERYFPSPTKAVLKEIDALPVPRWRFTPVEIVLGLVGVTFMALASSLPVGPSGIVGFAGLLGLVAAVIMAQLPYWRRLESSSRLFDRHLLDVIREAEQSG